jgi:hypothetical protein
LLPADISGIPFDGGRFQHPFLKIGSDSKCRRLDFSNSMNTSTSTLAAPSVAGTNHDNSLRLQAETLRRLFAIGLPLAIAMAPLVYGASR